jgi:uncharacterized cupin superfamily protein
MCGVYSIRRSISEWEKKKEELFYILDDTNSIIRYRSKIILLAGEGYTAPEI